MASRAEEVIDLVTRKSYSIPIGTELGMKRMKCVVKSSLGKKTVEDEISIIKNVDFSFIEEAIDKEKEFPTGLLYVDVMPKLDARRLRIRDVNTNLADTFSLKCTNLSSPIGMQRFNQYEMPIRRYHKDKIKECHLVFNTRDGRMTYPSFKNYHSPIVKFDCYANMAFGKEIVKDVYDTLSNMIKKSK